MAEAQVTHHHISNSLLKDLRQVIEAAQPGGERDTLDWVHEMAQHAAWQVQCCYRHGRAGLQVAKDAIFKNEDLKCMSAKMARQISYLGVLTMELFSSEAKTQNMELWSVYKPAVWKAALMVSYCTPEMAQCMSQTCDMRKWIKDVFCCGRVCPSPYLRLEMIRFMMMWPDTVLREHHLGHDVLHTLALLGSRLMLHDMLPRGRLSLSGPLATLLQNFHNVGVLRVMICLAFGQITRLRIGAEAKFIAHLLRLLGEKAKALRYMCHNASLDLAVVKEEYQYLFDTLNLLITSDSCKVVFRLPGIAQLGAVVIAISTISLYKSSFRLAAADEDHFRNLTTLLNDLFQSVRRENEILGTELMSRRQEKILARAARLADKVKFPLQYMPLPRQEVVPENCPESFLDAVTGRLMEQPVMVSSRFVVDASTLVGFLLFSDDHIPFTLLPDLQQKINVWKRNLEGRPQQEEFAEHGDLFQRVMARYRFGPVYGNVE